MTVPGLELPRTLPVAADREEPIAVTSFDDVYRENFRFVWRTVRRLGIADRYLEDVTQEVFLVVHRRLADFEGRSSVRVWLYGIVRRVAADHRRTLQRKPSVGSSGEEQWEAPDTARPDLSAELADKVRLLHRILSELDEDKREVFVLSEFEQMTMAEISDALGVNPNTVSSRLRASRRLFEQALERLLPDDRRDR